MATARDQHGADAAQTERHQATVDRATTADEACRKATGLETALTVARNAAEQQVAAANVATLARWQQLREPVIAGAARHVDVPAALRR